MEITYKALNKAGCISCNSVSNFKNISGGRVVIEFTKTPLFDDESGQLLKVDHFDIKANKEFVGVIYEMIELFDEGLIELTIGKLTVICWCVSIFNNELEFIIV